jgi:presenilin-like A22 family membrane protease
MKHPLKIVLLLIGMFFVTQLLGLAVSHIYASQYTEAPYDNVPYGMTPPADVEPTTSLISIIFAIGFAVVLILLLMKFRTELFLRIWFLVVIILALSITINAAFMNTGLSSIHLDFAFFTMSASSFLAMIIALPLAFTKIFRSNFLVHNLTELMVYPGIAVIFIPLLNIWTTVLLLVIISVYDMYAVWHVGFMQKMAKYQIENVKVFAGFFIPNLGKKERDMIKNASRSKSKGAKLKKIKFNVAILGGGDVIFPLILSGVVLRTLGIIPALMVVLGATLALSFLFYISKKGKFYPAMPFITSGCLIALGLVWFLW